MYGVFPFTCPHCSDQSNVHIRGDRPHLISCTGSKCRRLLVVEPRSQFDGSTLSFSLLIRRVERFEFEQAEEAS